MAGDRAEEEQRSRNGECRAHAEIEDESRAERRAEEHGCDGEEAAANVRIRVARKMRIGSDSRQGQRKHRRRQVGYAEAPRGGTLHAHGERKKSDEGVGGDVAYPFGRHERYRERGTDCAGIGITCEREKSATMVARAPRKAARN